MTRVRKKEPAAPSACHDALRDFRAISAVEGLHASEEMRRVFEMFEREDWPHERRREFLKEKYGNQPR